MNPLSARRVRTGTNNTSLAGFSSHRERLASERRILLLLNRAEERVEVEMEYLTGCDSVHIDY